MKKGYILLFSVLFLLIISIFSIRAQQNNPFQTLSDAVNQLTSRASSLETETDSLQVQINNLNTLIANPALTQASYDMFMRVDGIPGESKDDKHKDWIDLSSFSHGLSAAIDLGGGGGAGRVNHQDFAVTKTLDKASPKLYQSISRGEHIREVMIELTRSTGDKQKFMEYKLSDVFISSVSTSGSQSSDPVPTESVTFSYSRIEWTYTEIGEDGKPKGEVKACWNVKENKGC